MGLINKSGSFSQYRVTTELPGDFLQHITDKIRQNAFNEIDEQTTQEVSAGWVNVSNMLDNKFGGIDFLKEPYIVMSLRIDVRKVPASALKRYCLEEEKRIKKLQDIDYLSKSRCNEIKESTKVNLLKRVIPSSKTYDMIWDYTSGHIIFASISTNVCDIFQDLFFKTFELITDSIHPAMRGSEILEKNDFPKVDIDNFTYLENIGCFFLTWLWHRVDKNENTFKFKDNSVQIWFDEKVVLKLGDSDAEEVVTCVGDSQNMEEIKSALDVGKRITQAKLLVVSDAGDWSFTLDSSYLDFKNMKTPKIIQDKDNLDNNIYDKIYFLNEIIDIITTIYTEFVIEYVTKREGILDDIQ